MKKIILLIMFIIYSAPFVYATGNKPKIDKENNNTTITNKLFVLETEVQNIKDTIVSSDKDNKKFLEKAVDNQNVVIANMQWYIGSLLVIISVIAAVFGFFIGKENKKTREAMKKAEEDYKEAQILYKDSFYKLNECYTVFSNKIKEFDEKFNNLYMEKEKALTELYDTFRKKAQEEANQQQKTSKLISLMNNYLANDSYISALKIAEDIINSEKENPFGYFGKAVSLSRVKDKNVNKLQNLQVALECINKAIELNPKEDFFKTIKAEIYMKQRNFEQALKIYESIGDKDFVILANIIEMEIILNNIYDAKQNLEKLKNKIENKKHQIYYNILSFEMDCCKDENKDINAIESYLIKNVFSLDTISKINWSFEEIEYLINDDNSYLNPKQKTNLAKFIELIKQENEIRNIKSLENIRLRNIPYNKKESINDERW